MGDGEPSSSEKINPKTQLLMELSSTSGLKEQYKKKNTAGLQIKTQIKTKSCVYILDYWIRKSQCISFNFGPLRERELLSPHPMFAASFGISIFGPGEPAFSFPSLPFKAQRQESPRYRPFF
jgi:hypothetical protein